MNWFLFMCSLTREHLARDLLLAPLPLMARQVLGVILVSLSIHFAICQVINVGVDFTKKPFYNSTIKPTLQIVVNPLITRGSPIHNQVFAGLKALQTQMTRFQPWYPYPALAVAQLEPPEVNPVCETVPYNQTLFVQCSAGGAIGAIEFASYGTPSGSCGAFAESSSCHLSNTSAIVSAACLGKNSCVLPVTSQHFADPCKTNKETKWLSVQVHCDGQNNNTHWNFSLIDPMVEDFMSATLPREVTFDFCTTPQWMWTDPPANVPLPSDPMQVDWTYPSGSTLRDPSFKQMTDYYTRVLSWYTHGGFIDEAGETHTSGYFYNITHWEIMNEIMSGREHNQSIQFYTELYDSIVSALLKVKPDLKFVGLALSSKLDFDYFTYFLNPKNHQKGIPLDYISFHFYAHPASRTDPATYEAMFPACDALATNVAQVIQYRDALSPETKIYMDEVGVILPNDTTTSPPPFPLIYWNAAAAEFAYIFGKLAAQDIDYLGMSQMVGYPSQYPSVSMVNWTTGAMTPRYWTLQLLLNFYRYGAGEMYTTTSSNSTALFAQAFTRANTNTTTMLLVNKLNQAQRIAFTSSDWQNAKFYCVDETTGFSPAPEKTLNDHTNLPMNPFAVCVVVYPSQNEWE